MSALGASDDEIMIEKLKNLGLRIFPDVDTGAWPHYLVWYSPSSIDYNDVDKDAAQGEQCVSSSSCFLSRTKVFNG